MDITFEVAAGYDDNPAEVSEAEGTGMVQYRVQLGQSVWKNEAGSSLEFYLDTMYSQYIDFDDNYLLRVGTELFSAPWLDRFRAGLFAEGTAYRDDLVLEDEYNTLLVGSNLQWLADARLTLWLQETYSRVDYRNPVSLPGQRSYALGMGRGKGPGGRNRTVEEEWITYSQEDSVWSTELTAVYSIGPDIQTDLSFLYRDIDSSSAFESYREIGGSLQWVWFASEFVKVFASGYWSNLEYDAGPGENERSDDVYGFSLGGSRSLGRANMFVQYDQVMDDSQIVGEDYEKMVVLCGVSYTF
jgi:hypothetical protein